MSRREREEELLRGTRAVFVFQMFPMEDGKSDEAGEGTRMIRERASRDRERFDAR